MIKKSVVGECLRAHHEGVSEFYILPFYVLAAMAVKIKRGPGQPGV